MPKTSAATRPRTSGRGGRRSSSDEPTVGGSARRGRELPPKGFEDTPRTPAEWDAHQARVEAHQLPEDTDPDSIDDPDVRAAFLRRLHDLADEDEQTSTSTRAPQAGGAPGKADRAGRTPPPGRRLSLPRPSMSDGSGFALGLVAYAVGLNYLRYGPAGVTAWFRAKFFNQTSGS